MVPVTSITAAAKYLTLFSSVNPSLVFPNKKKQVARNNKIVLSARTKSTATLLDNSAEKSNRNTLYEILGIAYPSIASAIYAIESALLIVFQSIR